MTEIKTARRRAGQARTQGGKRQERTNRAKIAFYAALTVAGILLYKAGAAYAYEQRGYSAVGGEIFALFLPALFYAISKTARDFAADIKKIMEVKDDEKAC